jgi:hypothetical protein
MDMEQLPAAIHEVGVYTDLLEVKGQIRAWPPRRVLDVLNSTQTSLLLVEQASLVPLARWGKAQPTVVEAITLNKREILFVWPTREAEVEKSDFMTVHKVPENVMAYAGPFIFRGTMHIISEASLHEAWDLIREDFAALTDPSVFCLTAPELSLREGAVVAFNKARTTAIHARK